MKGKLVRKLMCSALAFAMVMSEPAVLFAADEFLDVEDVQALDAVEEVPAWEEAPAPQEGAASGQEILFSDQSFEADTDVLFGDGSAETGEEGTKDRETPVQTFREFVHAKGLSYQQLSKEELGSCYQEYLAQRRSSQASGDEEICPTDLLYSGGNAIQNGFLEVVVSSETGRFTIGTLEGNPNYTSDNDQKLLFGHPDPWSSDTLIKIGEDEYFFYADNIAISDGSLVANMNIPEKNVEVIQTLELIRSGNSSYEDTVRISYRAINTGSTAQSIGIRIMLDTMIADNDYAEFRIPGTGNLTERRIYQGSEIPQSYQVYDDLDNPTTLATGYLYRGNERRPDTVYFTNWPSISEESWNYSCVEGETLGDSAVAVVYDPIVVGGGGAAEVSTYYGVSVGNAISGADGEEVLESESVGKDQLQVRVKDASSDAYLEGAAVTVEDPEGNKLTGVTEEDGTFLFEDVRDYVGKQVLVTVEKDQYKEKTSQVVLQGGESLVLTLKNESDTAPEITSVMLGDTELLMDTISYLEDTQDEVAESPDAEEVQIKVTSDTENCVYYLMQDESILEKNDTGIFTLKTLKKAKGTVIEKLKSQSLRYIRCVSPDGQSSKETNFGLRVSLPTVSAKGITKMKFMEVGNSTVGENSLAALFLGNSLTFGMNELLDLEIEVDDSGKVSVGLNLEKMPRTQKEIKEVYDALLKMETRDYHFGKVQPKLHMGGVETTVSVAGYGEGYLDEGAVMVDLQVKVCGKIKGSHTTNYFWIVPLYITVGAEGSITAEVTGNIKNQDGLNLDGILPTWYSGTIEPSVSVFLEGGVGTKGIANLGVEGRGTLSYTYDFVSHNSKATLGASAALKAAVWKFEKSLQLAEGELVLYDSNRASSDVYYGEENIYEQLDQQDFLLADGGSESGDLSLNTADSSPIYVNAGGTTYKFWIRENENEEFCNASELVYQKKVDGGYTEPVVIDDDHTSDFAPSVAVDEANKKIIVVWQDTKESFKDDTVTIEDMAGAAEISMAVMDYSTDIPIDVYSITDNDVVDTIPAVSIYDGKAALAWYHTENGALETELPSYVCCTYVDYQGNKDEVQKVNLGEDRYIFEIAMTTLDGKPAAAYTLTEGSGAEIVRNTRRTGYVAFGDETPAFLGGEEDTNGSMATGRLGDQEYLFWYQNGNIAYRNSANQEAAYVFAPGETPETLSQDFVVVSAPSKTYVLWVGTQQDSENERILYGSIWEGDGFGDAHRMASLGEGNVTGLTGFVENDTLTVSYCLAAYGEDGSLLSSELVEKTVDAYTDLALLDVTYDDCDVELGEKLPMILKVKNLGNQAISSVTVRAADGYEAYEKEYEITLKPGEEEEISYEGYVVPQDMEGLWDLEVLVSCDEDGDTLNNTTLVTFGYTVLFVERQKDVMMNNEEYLKLLVTNDSGIDARDVGFRILADAKDGSVLHTENWGELKAHDSKIVYFPRKTMAECKVAYAYISTSSPIRESQSAYVLMGNSNEGIRYVVTSGFAIGAGEGGQVAGEYKEQYDSDTWISVKAEPEEGYVFDKWVSEGEEGSASGSFENEDAQETTFVMPENSVQVTALFKKEVKAAGVTFAQETVTLLVGEEKPLVAEVTPTDASDKCTYESSDDSIASVDKDGVVIGNKKGSAVIKVTCNGFEAECEVTVEDIPVTAIRVIYPTLELNGIGTTDYVETLLTPADASEALEYTTQDTGIIEVDKETGMVTAKAVGQAVVTVRAVDSDVTAQCVVEVKKPLTGIRLSEGRTTIGVGKNAELSVLLEPADTTDSPVIDWTVYNPNILSLEPLGENSAKAVLKGLSAGTTLVEARAGSYVQYCNVTITQPAAGVILTASALELGQGESRNIGYSLQPSTSTDRVTFASGNAEIAAVDENGVVYGVMPGVTQIVATAESGVTAACTVTVKENSARIVTSLEDLQSPHPYTDRMSQWWSYNLPGAISITLTFDGQTMFEENADYLYVYDGNKKLIGSYTGSSLSGQTVTIPGSVALLNLKTNASGTAYGFKVTSAVGLYDMSQAVVSPIANQFFTGSAIEPAVTVSYGGRILSAGTDYSVAFGNNVNIGQAEVTITGMGAFTGTLRTVFHIVAPSLEMPQGLKTASAGAKSIKISWKAVSMASGYQVYRYDSKKKSYTLLKTLSGNKRVSYTDKSRSLKRGLKYKYKVVPFFKAGSATVTGPEAYLESALAPAGTAIRSLKAGKKTITVKYKKSAKANGYEIYVSMKKTKGYKRAAVVGKAGKTSAVLKKLKSGKKYYVKLRTFVKTKNGKIYSSYTKPKAVKVK